MLIPSRSKAFYIIYVIYSILFFYDILGEIILLIMPMKGTPSENLYNMGYTSCSLYRFNSWVMIYIAFIGNGINKHVVPILINFYFFVSISYVLYQFI